MAEPRRPQSTVGWLEQCILVSEQRTRFIVYFVFPAWLSRERLYAQDATCKVTTDRGSSSARISFQGQSHYKALQEPTVQPYRTYLRTRAPGLKPQPIVIQEESGLQVIPSSSQGDNL